MKTATLAPTTLKVTIAKADQNIYYRELLTLEAGGDTHKLQIEIRSNAYKFQSWAKVERWDGAKWQNVDHIVSGAMKTEAGLYARNPPPTAAAFLDDRRALLEAAGLVLA